MADRSQGTPIRLGIIGAGRVTANHHLPALYSLPQIETAALADVDAVRLSQVAERFGIPGRYTDPHALLAEPGIQAVAICTPPPTHAGLALAALDAGKHVFIEKPLVLSLHECDDLQTRAAAVPQQKTTVGFNLRWHRLMVAARRIIQSGELGAIRAVRLLINSSFHQRHEAPDWRNTRRSGGSVILEQGSHGFDLVRFLVAGEFAEVYALAQLRDDIEEMVTITGRLDTGIQVSLLFGDRTADALEVDVFGVDARLHVSGYRFDSLEVWPVSVFPGSIKTRVRQFVDTVAALPAAWPNLRRGGDFANSYRSQWEHFAACVQDKQNNRPSGATTLHDGRQALQVALASLWSVRAGQPVTLAAGLKVAVDDASLDQVLL